MDVIKVLAELRQEKNNLEEAIITLERLARSRGKRRGRPPAWMSQGSNQVADTSNKERKRRGRPPGSKNKKAAAPGGENKDITKMSAGAVTTSLVNGAAHSA